jgi:hypothetical protein
MRLILTMCLLTGVAGAQETITTAVSIAKPYDQIVVGDRIYAICEWYGYCVPTVQVPLPEPENLQLIVVGDPTTSYTLLPGRCYRVDEQLIIHPIDCLLQQVYGGSGAVHWTGPYLNPDPPEQIDIPAISRHFESRIGEHCAEVYPEGGGPDMDHCTRKSHYTIPAYDDWTCADKSRGVWHDESNPPKWYCRKPQTGDSR